MKLQNISDNSRPEVRRVEAEVHDFFDHHCRPSKCTTQRLLISVAEGYLPLESTMWFDEVSVVEEELRETMHHETLQSTATDRTFPAC